MAATTARDDLADFTRGTFTHEGTTHDVFRSGEGPAVIVIAEIPGITPKVAEFARRVRALGCSVWMPVLFGDPGRAPSGGYIASSVSRACVSREFTALATGTTAPVTDWLRALARHAHATCGGPGVGAVGMCFTGGFALGMMVDPELIAPVLSQPSLPIGFSKRARASVKLSAADLRIVKERVAAGTCVLGLRFTGDAVVPAARFETLRRELGDGFIGVEIDSSPGNQWGIPKNAHSVLTEHLVDEPGHPTHDALEQVLEFFRSRLLPA
ncbi:MAG: dienelactone hydrolase family protein [Acidobacteria bacterium]|nr:dienelactone hydrolase family protein [Acidobacteriota bacterium]